MQILKKNEKANPYYGIETHYITDEMIEALKEGNRLYTDIQDGEYALIIKYKKGRQKNGNMMDFKEKLENAIYTKFPNTKVDYDPLDLDCLGVNIVKITYFLYGDIRQIRRSWTQGDHACFDDIEKHIIDLLIQDIQNDINKAYMERKEEKDADNQS